MVLKSRTYPSAFLLAYLIDLRHYHYHSLEEP